MTAIEVSLTWDRPMNEAIAQEFRSPPQKATVFGWIFSREFLKITPLAMMTVIRKSQEDGTAVVDEMRRSGLIPKTKLEDDLAEDIVRRGDK